MYRLVLLLLFWCLAACEDPPITQTPDVFADLSSEQCGLLVCSTDEACCGYTCVSPQTDPEHCGACGNACAEGEVCESGTCRCGNRACPEGDACCDIAGQDTCVDALSNPQHCGGCNIDCATGERCAGGRCTCLAQDGVLEACSADETCCPGIGCRALDRDARNCGLCGHLCGAGEVCDSGACTCGDLTATAGEAACEAGSLCCGNPASCKAETDAECQCGVTFCGAGQSCCDVEGLDTCVDTSRDAENCGTCGTTCGVGERCQSGRCTCAPGLDDCDGDPSNGCESRLSVDVQNCGACGQTCGSGAVCDGGQCRTACQSGLSDCGGSCVDLQSRVQHCGACGAVCDGGNVCNGAGSCDVSCQAGSGFVHCSGDCVALARDVRNCGACNQGCAPGLVCDGTSVCALSCQPGLTDCGGSCYNLLGYRRHCGACGNACPPGEVCDGSGQCALSCQAGLSECAGNCVDLQTEFGHCGACGNVCSAGERCIDGACRPSCPPGQIACDGVCISPQSDDLHCGGCNRPCNDAQNAGFACIAGVCVRACPDGLTDCGAAGCVDLTRDIAHCGACGDACLGGESCITADGQTACSVDAGGCTAGQVECDGVCVDTQSNRYHCDGCGQACERNEACVSGSCACVEGFDDCDGDPANGCESNVAFDPQHCSACNAACLTHEVCGAGTCLCPEPYVACNGSCVSLNDDPLSCGACGNACGSGDICLNGLCYRDPVARIAAPFRDTNNGASASRCMIRDDGSVGCWGSGREFGLLGYDGSGANLDVSSEPITPPGLDGNPRAVAIDMETTHACVLLENGEVRCWATDNGSGKLGCGTCTGSDVPQTVTGIDGTTAKAVDIAVGDSGACAVLDTGAVLCWGSTWLLGTGSTSNSPTPVPVSGIDGSAASALQIDAGDVSVCAVINTGAIWCWGNNGDGQLGTGTNDLSRTPTPVSGITDASHVVVARNHVCAIHGQGMVSCWGANVEMAVGDPATTSDILLPYTIPGLGGPGEPRVLDLAASEGMTCALLDTGVVGCWGRWLNTCNFRLPQPPRELPTCSRTNCRVTPWIEVFSGVIDVAVSNNGGCGLTASGTVSCWGSNSHAQLGVPYRGTYSSPTPTSPPLTDVTDIVVAQSSVCALRGSSSPTCWGNNNRASLAVATAVEDVTTPQDLTVSGLTFAHIDRHGAHACGITDTGAVYCWGYTRFFGDTNTNARTEAAPVLVPGIDGTTDSASALCTGSDYTCVLLDTDEVRCWGYNLHGQLGIGNTTDTPTPTTVVGFDGSVPVRQLSCGGNDACLVTDAGAVFCWGQNTRGQVGDGTRGTPRDTPAAVPEIDGVAAKAVHVETHAGHTCALLDTGGVMCWGSNSGGNLGDGTTTERLSPVAVTGLNSSAVEISVGNWLTCALLDTGAVECWGYDEGKLGTGTWSSFNSSAPVGVQGIDGTNASAIAIDSGGSVSCAVLSDGSTRCWGDNISNQMGTGSLAHSCLGVEVTP